ncbi:MAG: hypothetical protein QOJ72_129, partial [Nocardioidaceae bacterium]|nr:hypothetical protein [Nocardioidaceae bacterium]
MATLTAEPTDRSTIRHTFAMKRSTFVTLGALTILFAQLVVRGVLGRHGYFSLDDFVFYTKASHTHLFDHDFLLTPYNGHVMPGAFAWVWVTTKLAPLNFPVVLWTMLILQLVIGLLMWRLLRLMFGNRPAILVPLTVFAFSTITLPASWWWAAAINQQPQEIAMLAALITHLLYVRSGRWYWAVSGPIALAAGLLFFEKTALVVPLVGVLTWMFFSEGTVVGSLVTALRRYWITWVGYLVVLLPYTLYYLTHVPNQSRADPTTADFVGLLDSVVRQAVVPGMIGGPWRWSDTGVVDSNASPDPLMQTVAFALVGAVVVLSVLVSRVALKAWGLAGLYLAMLTVLLTVTRGSIIGAVVIGSEYRYLTDFCLVIAVCGALAFLPLVFTPWWKESPSDPTHDELPSHVVGLHVPTVVGVVVAVLVAGSVYSTQQFADRWTHNPARTYVDNATRTMKGLTPDDRLYNGVVPTKVVWKLLYPANLPTSILGPLGLHAKTLRTGETTDRLMEFNATGRLQPSTVTGVGTNLFESKDCLVDVHSTPRVIPLTSKVFEWPWILEMTYVADGPGTLHVQAGPTTISAPIGVGARGFGDLQTIYAAVRGGYDSITLSAPGNGFCIKTLAIGAPQPHD